MPRDVSVDMINALKSDGFDYAVLIKIDFLRGTQYWTDYGHDLVYSGNTYNSKSSLVEVSRIVDTTEVTVGTFTISMQDVDKSSLGIVLNQPVSGRRVDVWRAVIQNGVVLGVIGIQIAGRMSSWSANEDMDNAVVNITATSHWADFKRTSGRRTTLQSQKRFFPNDTGLKYAHSVTRKLTWGN